MADKGTVEVASASVVLTPKMPGLSNVIRKELSKAGIKGLGGQAGDEWEKGFKGSAKADVPDPDSKKMQGQGKKAGSRFGGAMKTAIAGALAGITIGAAFNIGKEVVTQASDLEQQIGAVGAVFKDNSGVVNQWAKDAAKDFGLSGAEFSKMSALMGSQLKNAGIPMDELAGETKNLIAVGSDMAAQFGGTTTEAVEAISSALRGERDPIERYGVSLTQAAIDAKAAELGFKKVGGTLSQEANAAATTALVMEQTADAHGAFARESNTFAGQQQRLTAQWDNMKATIGTALLPVLTSLFTWFNDKGMPAIDSFIGKLKEFAASDGFTTFVETSKNVLSGLVTTLQTLAPFIVAIGASYLAWNAVLAINNALTWAQYLWQSRSVIVGAARIAITNAMTVAQQGLNAAMRANPIGAIITVIFLLVAAFVVMYNKVGWFRTFIDTVWAGIKVAIGAVVGWFKTSVVPWFQSALTVLGSVFSWLYNNIIKPIWTGIRIAIAIVVAIVIVYVKSWIWIFKNVLAPVFVWLYNQVVKPIFNGIAAVFRWIWNSVIKPVFGWIMGIITNHVVPAFQNFLARVQYVWKLIQAAFRLAWAYIRVYVLNPIIQWIRDKIQPRFEAMKNTITRVWDSVKSGLKAGWDWIKGKVFDPLSNVIKNTIPNAFTKGKDAIGTAWDKIKKKVSDPVEAVVDTVYNDGIRKVWNKVAETFGLDELDEFSFTGYRRGGDPWAGDGRVRGPGSGTSDSIPARLGRGEFVVNARATRANLPLLHAINGKKGKGAPKTIGGMPAFKNGGMVWNNLWAIAKENLPGVRLTSAKRNGAGGSYHNTGRAVDLAGPRPGDSPFMMKIFNFLHDNYGQSSELIYTPAGGRQIKNGRHMTYGGSVAADHYDHVHWANTKAFSGATAGASGSGGGGFDLDGFLKPFTDMKDKLVEKLTGDWSGSPVNDLAGKAASKILGAPITWIKENVSKFTDFAGDMANGVNAATAKAQVKAVAALYGWGSGDQWQAILKLVQGESSWDPKAANPGSSARGLFQKMTSLHGPVEATAAGQARWGLDYIKKNYGTPVNAYNKWSSRSPHWYRHGGEVQPTLYDRGGVLEPGVHTIANKTRKPEYILPADVTESLMKGDVGNGVQIKIDVHGNADPKETGLEVADQLNFLFRKNGIGGF